MGVLTPNGRERRCRGKYGERREGVKGERKERGGVKKQRKGGKERRSP